MTGADKLIIGGAVLIVGVVLGRGVMQRFIYPHLKVDKFHGYFPDMDELLLLKLDTLFEEIRRSGFDAEISAAPGSTGRDYGPETSQHYALNGPVRAVDFMVWRPLEDGNHERLTDSEFKAVYDLIREVGFSGIGAAPDWHPYSGFHVDTRPTRDSSDPAQWAALNDSAGRQTTNNPIEKAFS